MTPGMEKGGLAVAMRIDSWQREQSAERQSEILPGMCERSERRQGLGAARDGATASTETTAGTPGRGSVPPARAGTVRRARLHRPELDIYSPCIVWKRRGTPLYRL